MKRLSGTLLSVAVVFLAARWFWSTSDTTETFLQKNVVICGASSGIGEQLAYRYSEQGAHIVLVARRESVLKNVRENCSTLGASSVSYVTADLSNVEGVQHVFQESTKRFGTIDVLVLNHILYEVQSWHGGRDLRDAKKSFDTNVLSYINLATLFLSSLQASHGRLVVVSSGLGVVTYPYFALYCSNKHALHGFFNSLRQDLALETTGNKSVSITISVLGAIATEKAREVCQDNPVAGKNGWSRASAVDASVAIIEASLRRERQMYFPKAMILHEMLSFHFPVFTEKLIQYVYGLNS